MSVPPLLLLCSTPIIDRRLFVLRSHSPVGMATVVVLTLHLIWCAAVCSQCLLYDAPVTSCSHIFGLFFADWHVVISNFVTRTNQRIVPCSSLLVSLAPRCPHITRFLSQTKKAEPVPMDPHPRCSCRLPLSRRRSWAVLRASLTSSSPGTAASSCARSASENRCPQSHLYNLVALVVIPAVHCQYSYTGTRLRPWFQVFQH